MDGGAGRGGLGLNWKEYDTVLLNEAVSPLLGRLYCYLRRNMDIESCVVGDADKKLISYQSIRENLEFNPPPRSNQPAVRVSRDQVKRMLSKLMDMGVIERLPGLRYGIELRFFLPLAVSGLVCPQEARHMRATDARHELSTDARHSETLASTGFEEYARHAFDGDARHSKSGYARHTSDFTTLSLNNTTYVADDDDWAWLKYVGGITADGVVRIDVLAESEKFDLMGRGKAARDEGELRAAWRVWILRAIAYSNEQREKRQ